MCLLMQSLTLVALVWGQADATSAAAVSPERKKAIDKAVVELGDRRFAVRQKAAKFLRQCGRAAEPALQRAADSPDAEVRTRARRFLSDLRYGILPGAPADLVELIACFRDGDPEERLLAFQILSGREQFDLLGRLIGLERDPSSRRELLQLLMQDDKAVARFFEAGRLGQLIDAVAIDQDARWRQSLLAELFTSEKVVEHLAQRGQLDRLEKLIDDEPSADRRRHVADLLLQNQASVGTLVAKGQLDFLLKVIAKDPEPRIRSGWIVGILLSPTAVMLLAADDRLEKLLAKAGAELPAEARRELLPQLFQNQFVMQTLLAKRSIDKLIALAETEADPPARGRALGTLLSSPIVLAKLQEIGRRPLPIQRARKEKDPVVRRELLRVVLSQEDLSVILSDGTARRELFELVKSEPTPPSSAVAHDDWRCTAIARLIQFSPEPFFRTPADTAWLIGFVNQADASQRGALLEVVISHDPVQQSLAEHDRFDAVVALIGREPAAARGPLYAMFTQSQPFTYRLIKGNRLDAWVRIATAEKDPAVRAQCLEGLFANWILIEALMFEQFDALRKLIDLDTQRTRRAMLLASFVASPPVVQQFVARKQIGELLKIAQAESNADARDEYLQRLFAAHAAVEALIDAGHFDALAALAKGRDGERRRVLEAAFVRVPKVVERLIAKRVIGDLLDLAGQLEENERHEFLQQLIQQPNSGEAIVDQGQAERLYGLFTRFDEPELRANLFQAVLSTPHFLQRLAAKGKLGKLVSVLRAEPAVCQQHFLAVLTAESETLKLFLAHGHRDVLMQLVREHPVSEVRGQCLAQLLCAESVLDKLVADKQVDVLLTTIENEEAEAVQAYLPVLFGQGRAIERLLDHDRFDHLLRIVRGQAADVRGGLWQQLMVSQEVTKKLVAKKQIGWLVTIVQEELAPESRRLCLEGLFANAAAMAALMPDHFDVLFALTMAEGRGGNDRALLASFVQSEAVMKALLERKQVALLLDVARGLADDARLQYLVRLISRPHVVSAVIDDGHFEALASLVRDKDGNRRKALLRAFYHSPRVLQELGGQEKLEEVLRFVSEQPANQKFGILQSIANPQVLPLFVEIGHAVAIIGQVETLDENRRLGVVDMLSRSRPLLEELAERNELSRFLKLLKSGRAKNGVSLAPELVAIVVDRGLLDELAEILRQRPDARQRGQQLGSLFVQPKVLESLVATKQPGRFLSIVEKEDDTTRQVYFQALFGNTNAMTALSQHGQLDGLIDAAGSEKDVHRRATLWLAMSGSHVVANRLSERKLLGELVRLAQEQKAGSRAAFLERLFQSSRHAVQLLVGEGYEAALRKLIDDEPDTAKRQRLFTAFANIAADSKKDAGK